MAATYDKAVRLIVVSTKEPPGCENDMEKCLSKRFEGASVSFPLLRGVRDWGKVNRCTIIYLKGTFSYPGNKVKVLMKSSFLEMNYWASSSPQQILPLLLLKQNILKVPIKSML